MSTIFKRLRNEADVRARTVLSEAKDTTPQPPAEPSGRSSTAKPEGLLRPRASTTEAKTQAKTLMESINEMGGRMRDRLAKQSRYYQEPSAPSGGSGILSGIMQGFDEIKEEADASEDTSADEESGGVDTEAYVSDDEGSSGGGLGSFGDKMKQSESGGRSNVQIELEDGRSMTGSYQFGDARLADYKKANKADFTTEEFRNNPELQEEVFSWHIADIDKAIDNTKGSSEFSRDGLRAVAHLGGVGGMRKYVKSGGQYNPSDAFGTSLSKYYKKFS